MTAAVAARPGGAYRLDASAMGMAMEGVVTDVQPPGTLGLTWQWRGEPEQTHVHLTVTPDGDGGRLRVQHSGFAEAGTRDDHIQGWNDCLDRLPGWLEGNR